MEETSQTGKNYKLDFQGKGNDFFGIIIINWLLTICSLGIYYPWAKAKKLQFLYGQTTLNGDSFAFQGTGKEMFKGFLKAILLFLILGGIFGFFMYLQMPLVGLLLFYFGIFAILPLAIHGSYRYRMSRTSWRGIRFGYRGEKQELAINFVKWIFLTIITFGIYGPWMSINLRKYLVGNVRFGDAEFDYSGDGSDYFILNLKGYFLSIFTLGIYFFWWQKDLFEYYIDNLTVNKENKEIRLNSTVTGGGFFKLAIVNLAIIVFTLGLGYAWAVTRTLNYIFNNIQLDGNIDLDALNQTEENYKDATGEDLSDFLDLDFVM
ncbi:YjgN family protein [Flavobacterium sp. WC2430]|uniref:YjgN family protein n=1 Tax=Flavobacterium sp. WC2430 TaxID=3234137 RepID=UPI00346727FA